METDKKRVLAHEIKNRLRGKPASAEAQAFCEAAKKAIDARDAGALALLADDFSAQNKPLATPLFDRWGEITPCSWGQIASWCFPADFAEGLAVVARHCPIQPLADKCGLVAQAAGEAAPKSLGWLLSAGCRADLLDPAGDTPLLDMIVDFGLFKPNFARLEDSLECVRLLWESEAGQGPGKHGTTPLAAAAGAPHPEPFRAIFKLGGAQAALADPMQTARACHRRLMETPELSMERFETVGSFIQEPAWSDSNALGAAVLAATQKSDERLLKWLLERNWGLQNPKLVNNAIGILTRQCWRPERQLELVERFFEFSDRARLDSLQSSQRLMGQNPSWHWRVIDCLLSLDPNIKGAKKLWKLADGSPDKLPRLIARKEAEALREAVAAAKNEAPAQEKARQAQTLRL